MASTTVLPHSKSRFRRWIVLLFAVLVLGLLVMMVIAGYIYKTQLKPDDPDEWIYPVKIGSLEFPVSVSKAILWISSPNVAPWLNGLSQSTSYGKLSLRWDEALQSTQVICEPCTAHFGNLSTQPLMVERIVATIHQDSIDQQVSGEITLGIKYPFTLSWVGQLTPHALYMSVEGSELPINHIYQTLAPNLEELKRAQINGTLNIKTQVSLPLLVLRLDHIQTQGFTVSGLGTEQLLHASSQCGPASNLPMNSWLVRSVISAEDQRFEQHPGYDLTELMAAYNLNAQQGSIVRGASTISQQTAKLFFAGSDKTFLRKLRELLYAVEMEQTLGKARIMQLYLDNAPWAIDEKGRMICGAESVAQYFFNVSAKDLKPEQAVWLAAMLHSPAGETQRWRESGKINLNRAIWIANYVRNIPGVGPRTRARVINSLKRDPTLGMTATTQQ